MVNVTYSPEIGFSFPKQFVALSVIQTNPLGSTAIPQGLLLEELVS